jgi:BirA family biotin operon repressor/biotin-[acetyl-CoA-carboxylase] ligase
MSTRGNVLKALEKTKGGTVSGEELATGLIYREQPYRRRSRSSKEGHRIDAITNKGYSLARDSDVLSVEGFFPM